MRILVDEMYDGLDIKLEDELKKELQGYAEYTISSVRKLGDSGEKMHSDYSILKHIDLNKIILITRDNENILACEENEMPYIPLGENPDIKDVVKKIREIHIRLMKKSN